MPAWFRGSATSVAVVAVESVGTVHSVADSGAMTYDDHVSSSGLTRGFPAVSVWAELDCWYFLMLTTQDFIDG